MGECCGPMGEAGFRGGGFAAWASTLFVPPRVSVGRQPISARGGPALDSAGLVS